MSKLHELIAVLPEVTNTHQSILEESRVTFQKKPEHFRGHARQVIYHDETRQAENHSDEKGYVTTVDDKLRYTLRHAARYFDLLYQMDLANQTASASITIDGEEITGPLPATFLLGLETRLKNLRDVMLTIPTLDPAIRWEEDPSAGKGVFRSAVQKTFRTEKQYKSKILYEATKEHPAQIREWTEDAPVADIEMTHYSTMWTPLRKAETLERLDKLIRAVKKARQRANSVEVTKDKVSDALFNYVLG